MGTENFNLPQLDLTNTANFPQLLNDGYKTIDKGLTLNVGTSTGTGNNYILDIGSITLNESNKGISFKFFADKDSTGAVTITCGGITGNLVKPNKNSIKNLKADAPYTITWDGTSVFFLASGADESDSTSVGTDGSNVLAPATFIGSDGEIHAGTMVERGDYSNKLSANGILTLPEGHYKSVKITQSLTNRGATTYTPKTTNQTIPANVYTTGVQTIKGDANLIASNIIKGKSIFGVSGVAIKVNEPTLAYSNSGTYSYSTSFKYKDTVYVDLDMPMEQIDGGKNDWNACFGIVTLNFKNAQYGNYSETHHYSSVRMGGNTIYTNTEGITASTSNLTETNYGGGISCMPPKVAVVAGESVDIKFTWTVVKY